VVVLLLLLLLLELLLLVVVKLLDHFFFRVSVSGRTGWEREEVGLGWSGLNFFFDFGRVNSLMGNNNR
jgi:hypothetical protein